MGQLNLRVLIEAVDRATKPLRGITRGITGLVRPAKIAGLAARSLGRDLRNMALMGAAAAAAAGVALFRIVKNTADAGDAALLASQKTGVQIQSYQRLAYAARMAGVETTGFDDSLKFLNLSIDAAGRGSKTDARAFAQLGVSIKDARGQVKPTEQLFREIADRMQSMPDGAQKTAIAMALFGRSGVDLIPMLNEGGDAMKRWGEEAQAAGLIMSEETARQADELNDSLDSLMMGVKGLGVSVVSGLLPDLIKLVGWLRRMIAANRPEIVRQLTAAFASVKAVMPDVIKGLQDVWGFLSDLNRLLAPVVKAVGGFAGVLDILAGLMIGRVALAIWAATKAVLGLNVAMYANPIGLVIAGIAALVFAGWLLYRNWDKVVGGIRRAWGGLVSALGSAWDGIKTAFRNGAAAVWQALPAWFRVVLRGGAFAVRIATGGVPSGVGQQVRDQQRATGMYGMRRPVAPNGQVAVDVTLHQGRPATVRARTSSPAVQTSVASTYRGGRD